MNNRQRAILREKHEAEALTPSKAMTPEQSGAVVPEEKKVVVAKKKPAKKKGAKK